MTTAGTKRRRTKLPKATSDHRPPTASELRAGGGSPPAAPQEGPPESRRRCGHCGRFIGQSTPGPCDRCSTKAASVSRGRSQLTITGETARSRSDIALAAMKMRARSQRLAGPPNPAPGASPRSTSAFQARARREFVIARPSELHPRNGSTPADPREVTPRRWLIDMPELRESLADGLARSRAAMALIPRLTVSAALAARDVGGRAIPALVIAGLAILISLALLMLGGAWLR